MMSAAVYSTLPRRTAFRQTVPPDVIIRGEKNNTEEEVGPDSTVTTTWQMYNSDVLFCTRGSGSRKSKVTKRSLRGGMSSKTTLPFKIG